jgi:hypothetical protein
MNRFTLLPSTVVAALALCTSALALQPTGTERGGGDPAPRPALLKPAPKPALTPPAPLPDTSALMPSGMYQMRLTIGPKSMDGPVKITRNGASVVATMGVNETLTGTLDPTGKLLLAGASGADQLSLTGAVQSHRGSGSVELNRGSTRKTGNFSLDPESGARKLQQWKTDEGSPAAPPTGGSSCGFWCSFKKMFSLG